jgi:hypothetical protein
MKLGICAVIALAAATAGCTETGRRAGGYDRRTVVVDTTPRYDRRVVERRVVTREYRKDNRRDRRYDRKHDRHHERRSTY